MVGIFYMSAMLTLCTLSLQHVGTVTGLFNTSQAYPEKTWKRILPHHCFLHLRLENLFKKN